MDPQLSRKCTRITLNDAKTVNISHVSNLTQNIFQQSVTSQVNFSCRLQLAFNNKCDTISKLSTHIS